MNSVFAKRREYLADTGQPVYEERRTVCRKPYKVTAASVFLRHMERAVLEDKRSPDAVCGRAKLTGEFAEIVCTKTVYNYINLGIIRIKSINLPLRVRRNNKRHHCRQNRRILGERIENRLDTVNERQEFEHWEIDTVVRQRTAEEVLLTLDERMPRPRHIIKIPGKRKAGVAAGLNLLRQAYGDNFAKVFRSITSDNGNEFNGLADAFKEGCVYFAHQYSSGEWGTDEKQNSLVRRLIPKGKNIAAVSEYTVQKTKDWINNLPRKILGYRNPEELFQEQLNHIASAA